MHYELYTDGSSNGRSGSPIGWGWILVKNSLIVSYSYGGAFSGTNNIAELTAALDGLNNFGITKGELTLVSDSKYVLNMISGDYVPQKNVELVKALQMAASKVKNLKLKWIKGHSGNPYNSIVDFMAKQGKFEHTRTSDK